MASPRDSRNDRRRFPGWLDPEAIAYALIGLLVTAWGVTALARWSVSKWSEGQRVVVGAAVGALTAAVVVALLCSRGRQRVFRVILVLAGVGLVSYVLATLGFQLPQSWAQ
jgi:hypothetical protein